LAKLSGASGHPETTADVGRRAAGGGAALRSYVPMLFSHLWVGLEEKLEAIPDEPPEERHGRPTHEVLEDLVASVRGLDSRMREIEEVGGARVRRSKRIRGRMHPMMVREMAHMVGGTSGDPLGILVIARMFREDVPWVYELASEAYRAIRERRPDASHAIGRLRRAIEMFMRVHLQWTSLGWIP